MIQKSPQANLPAVRRLAEARIAPARQVSAPAGGKPLTVADLFDRRPSPAWRLHALLSALSLSRRIPGSLPSAALLMIRAPLNPSIAYDWLKPPSSYHGCGAVSTSELETPCSTFFFCVRSSGGECRSKSAAPSRTPCAPSCPVHLLLTRISKRPTATSRQPAKAAHAQPGIHKNSNSNPSPISARPMI